MIFRGLKTSIAAIYHHDYKYQVQFQLTRIVELYLTRSLELFDDSKFRHIPSEFKMELLKNLLGLSLEMACRVRLPASLQLFCLRRTCPSPSTIVQNPANYWNDTKGWIEKLVPQIH